MAIYSVLIIASGFKKIKILEKEIKFILYGLNWFNRNRIENPKIINPEVPKWPKSSKFKNTVSLLYQYWFSVHIYHCLVVVTTLQL